MCRGCKQIKALEDFPFKSKKTGLRHSRCKPCAVVAQREWLRKNKDAVNARRRQRYTPERGREANVYRRHGITRERYEAMLEEQGGVCAVCGEIREWRGRQVLHVDHDHATGVVRGLLCHYCNVALGLLQDNEDRIIRLAAYLVGSLTEQEAA